MITIFLIIYFSFNTYLCTQYYDESEKYNEIKTVAIYVFGVPYFLGMSLKILFFLFFNDYFQIPFFYKFYFTDKFKKESIDVEQLELWKSKKGKSLKDRIYIHGINLLIKRAKS